MVANEGTFTQVWPLAGTGYAALTVGFVAGLAFPTFGWETADLLIDVSNKGSVTRLDIQLEADQSQGSSTFGAILDTSAIAGGIVTVAPLEYRFDITTPGAPFLRFMRIPVQGVEQRILFKAGLGVVTGSLFAAWVRRRA